MDRVDRENATIYLRDGVDADMAFAKITESRSNVIDMTKVA